LEVKQFHSSEETGEQNLKRQRSGWTDILLLQYQHFHHPWRSAKEADKEKISQQEYANNSEHWWDIIELGLVRSDCKVR
tara:strand:- start:8 stop:244 length:237 start_codon:yes stop_codon:yes gene_type:complete